MLAGPSEVLVVADGTADAEVVAAETRHGMSAFHCVEHFAGLVSAIKTLVFDN